MIGVVIIGHGRFARELRRNVEEILKTHPRQVTTVSIPKRDTLKNATRRVARAVGKVENGCGVLALVDLFGATPANAAKAALNGGRGQVIAGVNTPMLVSVLEAQSKGCVDLGAMVERAYKAGRSHIIKMGAAE